MLPLQHFLASLNHALACRPTLGEEFGRSFLWTHKFCCVVLFTSLCVSEQCVCEDDDEEQDHIRAYHTSVFIKQCVNLSLSQIYDETHRVQNSSFPESLLQFMNSVWNVL